MSMTQDHTVLGGAGRAYGQAGVRAARRSRRAPPQPHRLRFRHAVPGGADAVHAGAHRLRDLQQPLHHQAHRRDLVLRSGQLPHGAGLERVLVRRRTRVDLRRGPGPTDPGPRARLRRPVRCRRRALRPVLPAGLLRAVRRARRGGVGHVVVPAAADVRPVHAGGEGTRDAQPGLLLLAIDRSDHHRDRGLGVDRLQPHDPLHGPAGDPDQPDRGGHPRRGTVHHHRAADQAAAATTGAGHADLRQPGRRAAAVHRTLDPVGVPAAGGDVRVHARRCSSTTPRSAARSTTWARPRLSCSACSSAGSPSRPSPCAVVQESCHDDHLRGAARAGPRRTRYPSTCTACRAEP